MACLTHLKVWIRSIENSSTFWVFLGQVGRIFVRKHRHYIHIFCLKFLFILIVYSTLITNFYRIDNSVLIIFNRQFNKNKVNNNLNTLPMVHGFRGITFYNPSRKSDSVWWAVILLFSTGSSTDQDSLAYRFGDTDSGLGRATPPRRAPSPGMSMRHLPSPSGPGSLPGLMTKGRRMFDDGSSDISSTPSSMMDYNGKITFQKYAFIYMVNVKVGSFAMGWYIYGTLS